jgi:uridine kinase
MRPSIYRPKLYDHFIQWVKDYQSDPLRVDALQRAGRTLLFLQEVIAVGDDTIVPSDSVVREFIGGSSLSY